MLLTSSTLSFTSTPSCRTLSACRVPGTFCFQKKQIVLCCSIHNLKDERKREVPYDNLFQVPSRQNGYISYSDENLRRRLLLFISVTKVMFPTLSSSGKTKSKSPYDEKRLLEQNRRVQKENNAPEDFPSFIREGFDVNVVTSENYTKCDSGLIYRDFEVGKGDCPKDGQQVIFHYIGYNESGRRIDSTYLQGSPAKIRLGNNALVPGFEKGIRDMRPGGKRRIIIPPELGPPVGPSTFFSSKQFEVFDVELLSIQDCQRRTIAFYSDVVCN